ncbi:1,3-propanediol dehydrogenase [Clostridium homopropionicum DSM 5847]|uniref:1,3-propanediol dehydrogenase n=1 Tax=Clostridium homopropionicum DSM 5847 TaxID=1121318 RepID=A0A0L6ZB99_9CLOT|nr:iron-containing alcohol dehydrogenase [Clostridium homopropionicum]KOA20088.1 1,3-propanediol dehydrogenase [Clostridium homopropionicum DSM 5847]SFG86341.1 alcohol dehydrogenase [Clostridium homopropionicum]
MSIFVFKAPNKIIYGLGSIKNVGEETAKYGKKALIVTGRSSTKKSGALDKVLNSLKENKVETIVFDQVESDPSVDTVEAGTKVAKEQAIDVIIALGGGSPLDAAKAISIMLTNPGKLIDYENKAPEIEGIPVIAVPTTAGTGSEVTRFSVITDTKRKIKMLLAGDTLIPKVAILDAELTITMPKDVTAATGMDALTHAIEAYISKVSQPASNLYALSAIKIISSNIIKAVNNGDNLEARENMLFGQMQAGLAFSNASVALVHAMSRPLGAFFKIPHGMANAILLPKVMEYNRASVPEKFKDIAEAMGENTSNLSLREASKLAVKAIKNIYDETGLPKTLGEVGVTEDSIETLAKDAFKSGSTLLNPTKASIHDIIKIYKDIY